MKLPDVVSTRQHGGSLKEDQRDSSAINSWPDIPSIRVHGCLLAPLGALPVCLLLVRASIAVVLKVIRLSLSTTDTAALLLVRASIAVVLKLICLSSSTTDTAALLLVRASIAVVLKVIRLSSSTTDTATLLLEASALTLLFVGRMSAGGGGFGEDLTSTVSSMTTSESGVSDLSRDSLVPWLFSELEWSTWGRLGDFNRLTTAF